MASSGCGQRTTRIREGLLAQGANSARRIGLLDEDETLFAGLRKAFRRFAPKWTLENYPDMRHAVASVKAAPPAAVLTEITMRGRRGIDPVRILATASPGLIVLVLTARASGDDVARSLRAGARGYLIKPVSPALILDAACCALGGEVCLCQRAQNLLAGFLKCRASGAGSPWSLTARELEIVECAFRRLSHKEIAQELGISPQTVHTHFQNIYGKLGVQNRDDLQRKFLE